MYLVQEPYDIHSACCDRLKKEPFSLYEKETKLSPIMGTMASESKRRENKYIQMGGCNVFHENGGGNSMPLSIWLEQDIWDCIEKYKIPIAEIYKKGANRTGCMFCGYGCQFPDDNSAMGWIAKETFETIHNYIDVKNKILCKGAVSATIGEELIIPINMRDGSLICRGKGNPDWLNSAPHGAGRLMSRSKAKEVLSMDDYQKQMSGIYSTSICNSTIDEAPMAYKPIDEIIECIEPTVEIVSKIVPIYNFKAK